MNLKFFTNVLISLPICEVEHVYDVYVMLTQHLSTCEEIYLEGLFPGKFFNFQIYQ